MKLVSMGLSLLFLVFIGFPLLVITGGILYAIMGSWSIPVFIVMGVFAVVLFLAKMTEETHASR